MGDTEEEEEEGWNINGCKPTTKHSLDLSSIHTEAVQFYFIRFDSSVHGHMTYPSRSPDEGDEVATDWQENQDDVEVDGQRRTSGKGQRFLWEEGQVLKQLVKPRLD